MIHTGDQLQKTTEPAPFVRGKGQWQGVVAIERASRMLILPSDHAQCNVYSARTLAFDGRRAIFIKLPYRMLKQHFYSDDNLIVYHFAEFKDGHLEIYERASKREFFLNAGKPQETAA